MLGAAQRIAVLLLVFSLGCGGCDDLGEPIHADCGNGAVDGLEVCDGVALNGRTCAALGFDGGTLGCSPTCGGFVVAGCEGVRDEIDPCSLCGPYEGCVANRCVSTCEGDSFAEDTRLEFDVQTVSVRGSVTVGGLPLALAGSLKFEGEVYWHPAVVPIAQDGTYDVTLVPGNYEVTWLPPSDVLAAAERLPDFEVAEDADLDFDLTPWTELRPEVVTDFPGELGNVIVESLDPRFGRVEAPLRGDEPLLLRDGEVQLWWSRSDGGTPTIEYLETTTVAELDNIEVPVIETSLRVTMNGEPVQSDGEIRAELVRRDDLPRPGWLSINRDRESWTLDADGHATGWMLDRPRDIALVINGPPRWGWLWAQRDVTPAAEIEVDLAAPRLAGEVRRNGGRLPNSLFDGIARGRLEFTSDEGYLSVELSDRGRGEFAVRLPPALWNVSVSGIVFAGALPVVPWDVAEPISLQADVEDHLIDVPAVRLAGQLTVNGARPDDDIDLETRGSLQLRAQGGGTWFSVPIPARGPAGWDVIVAPGTYDAELVRWWFASGGERSPTGVLPLGNWLLDPLEVPFATRYDVDVRLHDVTVSVEADEDVPPGLLWFTKLPDQRVARQIDTTEGPVTVALYPGYYEVAWAPYEDGRAAEPVVLDSALVVDGTIDRTYDVTKVELSAAILVNGIPAVDAGELQVELTRYPYANWTSIVSVAPTGPAEFRADVTNGYHAIVLEGADHPTLPANGVTLHEACRPN